MGHLSETVSQTNGSNASARNLSAVNANDAFYFVNYAIIYIYIYITVRQGGYFVTIISLNIWTHFVSFRLGCPGVGVVSTSNLYVGRLDICTATGNVERKYNDDFWPWVLHVWAIIFIANGRTFISLALAMLYSRTKNVFVY